MSPNNDCIFCKIIANQIPSPRVFENEDFICIRDIQPQAKSHFLVVPKKHVESLDAIFSSELGSKSNHSGSDMIGELFEVATHVAREQKLLPGGFRTVFNTGKNGGQTVFHLHLHILGGEPLSGSFG